MQIGEALNIIIDAGYDPNKCPFCGKDEHSFPSNKAEASTEVVSKPDQLKCSMSGEEAERRAESDHAKGQYAYTIAKHHLISAKQCFAKLKPLVRMATTAKYDINDPHNGIGLPTTHYKLKYPTPQGKKYGDLSENDKTIIAYSVMNEIGAQWHVGHHSFKYELPFEIQSDSAPSAENWGDEVDELTISGHETGYDTQIIQKLINVMLNLFSADSPICEEPDDKSDEIQKKLKDISKAIKDDLEKFQGKKPWESKLYVSRKAYDFAMSRKEGEPDDAFDLEPEQSDSREANRSPSSKRR